MVKKEETVGHVSVMCRPTHVSGIIKFRITVLKPLKFFKTHLWHHQILMQEAWGQHG